MLTSTDKVLVTGATGFTGNYLIRALAETGCEIHAIARPSSRLGDLENLPVTWHRGNVYDEDLIEKAMQGVNYVFHLAAAYREAKAGDEVYSLVHIKSTQLLADAASRQPDFRKFVHVSTVGVLGHIENPPANEESPYNPGDIYQSTKVEGEQWILAFSKEKNLPLTVIRPAAIYGPGDRRLLKIFKLAKMTVTPILGFGKGLYHLIHVEDLVRYIVAAATTEKALGQIYICGNPQTYSIPEMTRVIKETLGLPNRSLRIPASPFFLIGYLCEAICKPLNIEPPIYPRRVAFFTKDRSFETSKIQRDLGNLYKYSSEAGIRHLTRWYVDQGWL